MGPGHPRSVRYSGSIMQVSEPRPSDYVPHGDEPQPRRPLGWADAAFLGGGLVAIVMMLVTTLGETQVWEFLVIAAALATCAAGAVKMHVWE